VSSLLIDTNLLDELDRTKLKTGPMKGMG
jgi:hypothetical protein